MLQSCINLPTATPTATPTTTIVYYVHLYDILTCDVYDMHIKLMLLHMYSIVIV